MARSATGDARHVALLRHVLRAAGAQVPRSGPRRGPREGPRRALGGPPEAKQSAIYAQYAPDNQVKNCV